MKQAIFIALSLALLSSTTQAQWSGEGDLAYSQVSGNSDSSSLALGVESTYEKNDWEHSFEFDTYSAAQSDQHTAESYRLNLNTRYTYNRRSYAFGDARYFTDRFSGYDYQTSVAGGFGRGFIDNAVTLLESEAGLGYRISEPEGPLDTESEVIFLMNTTWDRVITETTTFESDWRLEAGGDNTYLQSELALKVAIFQELSVRMSYTIKHNTEVPVGRDHTDTKATVGLNYSF